MTLDEYKSFMRDEYFDICREKSVLEIGPHEGIHTKLISQNNPEYLELIEPFKRTANYCETLPGVDRVIKNDVFFVLTDKHPMDVVVCCGVLYHLHSPLHLLELIVNNCDPNYIILDGSTDQKHVGFLVEVDNIIGNRQIIPNWRSAGYNLFVPFEIVDNALRNMGYINVKKYNFGSNMEFSPKINFWVGSWKRRE